MNMSKNVITPLYKINILRNLSSSVKVFGDAKRLEIPSSTSGITLCRRFSQNLLNQEQIDKMNRATDLLLKYNSYDYENLDGKHAIIYELFNPASKGHKMEPFIEPPFYVQYGHNITVGNNFAANWECIFQDSAPITIGEDVMFGPGVQILTGCGDSPRPVKIGNKVWIGGRTVVYPGVTIGDSVTVAAGSVVDEDLPSNVIAAGNPAKIKGRIGKK